MAEHSIRKRPRIMLSLAPETIAYLGKIVSDEDAKSLSRAIDLLSQYHQQNRQSIRLELRNENVRTQFFRYCAKNGFAPQRALAQLVSRVFSQQI